MDAADVVLVSQITSGCLVIFHCLGVPAERVFATEVLFVLEVEWTPNLALRFG